MQWLACLFRECQSSSKSAVGGGRVLAGFSKRCWRRKVRRFVSSVRQIAKPCTGQVGVRIRFCRPHLAQLLCLCTLSCTCTIPTKVRYTANLMLRNTGLLCRHKTGSLDTCQTCPTMHKPTSLSTAYLKTPQGETNADPGQSR